MADLGEYRNGPAPEQYLVWEVQAEKAGDYEVTVNYLCGPGGSGTTFEVTAPKGKLAGTTHETGSGWKKPNWELQRLSGTVKLPAGKSHLEMRILQKAGFRSGDHAASRSRVGVAAGPQGYGRASAQDTRQHGMDGGSEYGLMTHWTSQTKPRTGQPLPYCDAAKAFDVDRYADMAKETGAGYVAFTTSHMEYYFPAPIQAIDHLVPGRTCSRDLIGDLADALNKRGLKLVVFCGYSIGDKPWAGATGYQDPARLNEFAKR